MPTAPALTPPSPDSDDPPPWPREVEAAPPPSKAPSPDSPEALARKTARREARRRAEASRGLDPWERYRALTDAIEEGLDLAETADRKVRFALVVMAGINVGLLAVTSRP